MVELVNCSLIKFTVITIREYYYRNIKYCLQIINKFQYNITLLTWLIKAARLMKGKTKVA